jgi:hypothetical protein
MNEASKLSQTAQPLSAKGEKIDALADAIREKAHLKTAWARRQPRSRKSSTPPGRICTARILIAV